MPKSDSYAKYLRDLDVLMQAIADKSEEELLSRLRAVPATDEEISSLRIALRERAEREQGMTPQRASEDADRILRILLDNETVFAGAGDP